MAPKTDKKPGAPLLQSEREAIVDLLHLCLYADAHISIKEGEFLVRVIETIGWDKNLSFSAYEQRSVAAARAARADEKAKEQFLDFAGSRLRSPAARELAVSLCADLFATDGTVEREAALLSQIRAVVK